MYARSRNAAKKLIEKGASVNAVKKPLWEEHPDVRTGKDLDFGERASDVLKFVFGTWTMLGLVGAFVVAWLLFMHDPGELRLNLGLSCTAAVQGIILQIAANRGDRISSELALATHGNSQELLDINQRQLEILTALRELQEAVEQSADARTDENLHRMQAD